MLTGENGILTQAQRAKTETENAARQEEEDLARLEAMVNGQDVPIIQVDDKNPGQLEQEDETTFVINSIEDLVFFSYDVKNGNNYEGKTVKLGTNLDFSSDKSYVNPNRTDFAGYTGELKQALISGTGFSPIGSQDGTNSFYGTFDGDNKAICSLYININIDEDVNVGLFSTTYGEIKNLGMVNIDVAVDGGTTVVGGIVGRCYNSIYGCYVKGNIKVTGNHWMPVGGICGVLYGTHNIENSYNLASINCENIKGEMGEANVASGGIVGQIEGEMININKCFNKGEINVNGGKNVIQIAGICAETAPRGINSFISNCYNNARLEGTSEAQERSYIGGIIGVSLSSEISNCYNLGQIIGNSENLRIGGIVSNQEVSNNITINNVFNMATIEIKNSNVYAVGGIIGLTAEENSNANLNNAYNIGTINKGNSTTQQIGSIAGTNRTNSIKFNNCYYLKETYSVGVGGSGSSTGVTELNSIDKFPSVLSVVNRDGVFKEDTNNINNGYPILEWQ